MKTEKEIETAIENLTDSRDHGITTLENQVRNGVSILNQIETLEYLNDKQTRINELKRVLEK